MTRTDPDYAAYVGVRYVNPEFIRQLRFGLDLGVDPDVYKKKFAKTFRTATGDERAMASEVLGALRYMLRNPLAGVVRYTEGEQYVWRDDEVIESSASVPVAGRAQSEVGVFGALAGAEEGLTDNESNEGQTP